MKGDQIVFLLLELVALVLVVRLWIKPGRRSVIAKVVWSIVLLVPLAGILAYLFIVWFPDDLSEGEPSINADE